MVGTKPGPLNLDPWPTGSPFGPLLSPSGPPSGPPSGLPSGPPPPYFFLLENTASAN